MILDEDQFQEYNLNVNEDKICDGNKLQKMSENNQIEEKKISYGGY